MLLIARQGVRQRAGAGLRVLGQVDPEQTQRAAENHTYHLIILIGNLD